MKPPADDDDEDYEDYEDYEHDDDYLEEDGDQDEKLEIMAAQAKDIAGGGEETGLWRCPPALPRARR